MKILVTFALETEFAPWRALRRFQEAKWGPAKVYLTEIGNAEVGVVVTGAGLRQAAAELSKVSWIEPDCMQVCISSGLAGALKPEYRIGQVLAARAVATEVAPAGASARVVESSAALVSFAAECGATVVNRFESAGRAINTAEEKQHLGTTADAVEMESFAVLWRARTDGIPAIAIRSISDGAEEDLPFDMNEVFTDRGKVSIPRVLGQVALRPQSLSEVVKLGRNSRRAAESLGKFLDAYIMALSERAKILESQSMAVERQPNP